MRRLQRLQDSVAQWKAKLLSNGRKCEERNRTLKEEKDAISKHFQVPMRCGDTRQRQHDRTSSELPSTCMFQELKGRMNKFREREGRRLQELTINSQAAISTLKTKLEKAERILKLAELTRKLETEREKVWLLVHGKLRR